jgi:hypothetical protein
MEENETIAALIEESYLHANQSSRELGLGHHADDWNKVREINLVMKKDLQ